jgi:16S rRNA (cytidine1402-2'-O)-methyltransferase
LEAENNPVASGVLYVVSTPIGNLGDITYRAVRVLQQVDLIAAEDTRTSRVLLQRYQITTPITSYHDFNENRAAPELVAKLKNNSSIALITDAGTPGISDPAFFLVKSAVDAGIEVQAVPGATALITALVISGLPCERFVFEGFLPVKKGRQTRLEQLQSEPRTIVLYESPHRLIKTLQELFEVLGDRSAVVARELTKKFEQVIRGKLSELIHRCPQTVLKGEIVIMVEGRSRRVAGQEARIENENEI